MGNAVLSVVQQPLTNMLRGYTLTRRLQLSFLASAICLFGGYYWLKESGEHFLSLHSSRVKSQEVKVFEGFKPCVSWRKCSASLLDLFDDIRDHQQPTMIINKVDDLCWCIATLLVGFCKTLCVGFASSQQLCCLLATLCPQAAVCQCLKYRARN